MDMDKSWGAYWNKENPEFDEIMYVTTKRFYENCRERYPLKNSDVLLDYGCGPGVLIQLMKNDCKKIIGVDTSSVYVEKCKDLFSHEINVSIQQIADFNDLRALLSSEKVNQVMVLSVIQYFSSLSQLTGFLDVFRATAQKERRTIRMLIADIIPTRHLLLMDFFEILYDAVNRRYLLKYLQFITKYLKETVVSSRKSKLQVDYTFFEQYAHQYHVGIDRINGLTNHKNRYSVEILFNP
ncbi:MAG: class I SAM-dependent methyltransferase [Chitinophagales bacterium]